MVHPRASGASSTSIFHARVTAKRCWTMRAFMICAANCSNFSKTTKHNINNLIRSSSHTHEEKTQICNRYCTRKHCRLCGGGRSDRGPTPQDRATGCRYLQSAKLLQRKSRV